MSRSNWRLKFISKSSMTKVIKESIGIQLIKKNSIIMNKSSTVPQSLVGYSFYIHKGLKYREIKILNLHVGFKFGEFILTRKPFVFPKKIKSKTYRN